MGEQEPGIANTAAAAASGLWRPAATSRRVVLGTLVDQSMHHNGLFVSNCEQVQF